MFISYIFIFIFGLIIGSFLNCVIYRLEENKSFLKGRSFCPACKHVLGLWDLIPVFSFLMLKGKCRYCKARISWQYPLVEISVALVFLLIFKELLVFDFITAVYLLIVACLLVMIFVFDLKHFIIPDGLIYPAIAIVFFYQVLNIKSLELSALSPLFSALGASGFFLTIFLASKGRWIGFGDVKLAFFMGLFLGFPNIIVALYFAFMIGAIIGIGLILAKRKGMKSEIPFGPFLIIGTFIAFFWGPSIINWYLKILIQSNGF